VSPDCSAASMERRTWRDSGPSAPSSS